MTRKDEAVHTLDWVRHGMASFADVADGRYEVWPSGGDTRWESYFVPMRYGVISDYGPDKYLGAWPSEDAARQKCVDRSKRLAALENKHVS